MKLQKEMISNQKTASCKKRVQPPKSQGEKRCEIIGGGQEIAVMVGYLITTIQMNLVLNLEETMQIHLNCCY